jgi:hypothetical protein
MTLGDEPCLVKISRTKSERDRLRSYDVLVDGRRMGRVRRGQSATLIVDPGRHQIEVKIDWKKSAAVFLNAQPGETLYLECGPTGGLLDAPRQLFTKGEAYLFVRQVSV